jgi:hypothetical protein
MSSPWKQQEIWNADAPPHGSAGVVTENRGRGHADGTEEWDQLRSSPDYDLQEMQGVSLPATFASPAAAPGPAGAPGSWGIASAAPIAAAPASPDWAMPAPGGSLPNAGSPAPVQPQERWPETAGVAHLAGDLFAGAQGEGLWRPMEEGSAAFQPATGAADDDSMDWADILARTQTLSADLEESGVSESWAFLPDAMLQVDGGADLLDEALQAGARAGLLDAGARLKVAELPPSPRPRPAAEGELPDLLEAALTAGERAGLMGR